MCNKWISIIYFYLFFCHVKLLSPTKNLVYRATRFKWNGKNNKHLRHAARAITKLGPAAGQCLRCVCFSVSLRLSVPLSLSPRSFTNSFILTLVCFIVADGIRADGWIDTHLPNNFVIIFIMEIGGCGTEEEKKIEAKRLYAIFHFAGLVCGVG